MGVDNPGDQDPGYSLGRLPGSCTMTGFYLVNAEG